MSYRFGRSGLIVVTCYLQNAGEDRVARFILDTGAELSVVKTDIAESLQSLTASVRPMVTASDTVLTRTAMVERIAALGIERRAFPLRVWDLPIGFQLDGLLGLDFFTDTRLTLDFRNRLLTLT